LPRLVVADSVQIESISRESHGIWGGGLSRHDYLDFWRELSDTSWGREHMRHQAWVDEHGRVLSSAKLYRPRWRLLGRESRACVIGAVFTPAERRGAGHAADMMRAMLQQARERQDDSALLFSDIGTRYYAALGFRELPADEVWGRLWRARSDADGWSVRELRPDDMPLVRRFHDDWCRSRPLAILRDEAHWEFLLARVGRFFDRLGDARLRPHQRVVSYRGEVLGYLFSVEGHGEWSVRELGARDGDPELMARVLAAGAGVARASGLRRFYGWLPQEVTRHVPDWKLRRRARERALPMLLPLAAEIDFARLGAPDAAFLPYQDQF
jgi:N-acetylglutamate synthase-like GNAT family acetyltransferase